MTIETIDIDLFLEIAKLHPNVIAQIFGYLPKCLLPHLLYFPPIRDRRLSNFVRRGNY